MPEDKNNNSPTTGEVAVKWGNIEDAPVFYANQLFVGHTDREFYIVFGDVQFPLLVNQSADELPTEVKVKPVARIMIAPQNMQEFTQAMNINLSKFLSKFGIEIDDD